MDEMSWRAQLAKSNINILNVHTVSESRWDVFYEFMYHPHGGQTKWCKTWTKVYGQYDEALDESLPVCDNDLLNQLKDEVLSLRKELEG